MATKDISDVQVCQACVDFHSRQFTGFASDILVERTGQPLKVVMRAMERAEDRGLIECGVSLRSAWVTDKGKALLEST